ncbi:PEP-CTERM sorting domain-containing protein [Scleromatobacter humisilvae]|uniref:PEP-CTERM sorting domain-containing protein n=1 Tax=Scleromatobacter humisilvae TaxID=2897159 RepID=A0A9X2C0F6_9BURK|nr:PEP-CTERM sorting domain-containing protein [Scleromatobacter humisilvae]MCK9684709.1 PEP-CTERM sorting domain-containing protein [Scleromatobacter humisilvae]
MRIAASVAAVLACLATSAAAQAFVDLDFDAANVPLPPGSTSFMPWNEAAPGWSHSDGDSTSYVSWFPNAGYSQSYVLLLSPFGSASGPYGFGLKSGTFHEDEPRGPFVYAEISQTGRLGPQVTTIELLSSSYLFEVTLDGTGIAMQPVGLDPTSPTYTEDMMGYSGEWTGDVSAFAGQVVNLQITDLQTAPNPPGLAIDQIEFLPVPEPSTAALLGLGLLATVLAGRRRALSPPGLRRR